MEYFDNENILEDDYPVYCGYLYVCDGEVIESDIQGTVKQLKNYTKSQEVRRCNISARSKKKN